MRRIHSRIQPKVYWNLQQVRVTVKQLGFVLASFHSPEYKCVRRPMPVAEQREKLKCANDLSSQASDEVLLPFGRLWRSKVRAVQTSSQRAIYKTIGLHENERPIRYFQPSKLPNLVQVTFTLVRLRLHERQKIEFRSILCKVPQVYTTRLY